MDIVENIYNENLEIIKYLKKQNQISYSVELSDKLRKVILLSSASFFENEITAILENSATKATNNSFLVSFLKNQALSRKYHTLFDWNKNNINKFLKLFSEDFKSRFVERFLEDKEIEYEIECFMVIGAERNKLVHENFGLYSLEKTTEEIMIAHKKAKSFVSKFNIFMEEVI